MTVSCGGSGPSGPTDVISTRRLGATRPNEKSTGQYGGLPRVGFASPTTRASVYDRCRAIIRINGCVGSHMSPSPRATRVNVYSYRCDLPVQMFIRHFTFFIACHYPFFPSFILHPSPMTSHVHTQIHISQSLPPIPASAFQPTPITE
jgi:hypothetical protein